MEFVIGTVAVIIVFFAGGIYMQKKAEKNAEQRIFFSPNETFFHFYRYCEQR